VNAIRRVKSRTGAVMPVLGQGTWGMGERSRDRAREAAALRLGFDLGLTLVDTAEMYGNGGAEEVVAEAMAGRRDGIFVVTKVLPQNASREGTIRAAERSLARLRTDRIDLYLLHWRGALPLEGTLEAFQRLRRDGKILHYGVSNFDLADLEEAEAFDGWPDIAADQVLYSLRRRAAELLIPWCVRREIVVMAYSPIDQGRLEKQAALEKVARRHGVSAARVALAWTIRLPGVIAIPKAVQPDHVRDNAAALELELTEADLGDLDAGFPPPRRGARLEML
jgi:diketogulonate reductase-like aldo/keto reductase